jgi:hypothetical protein
MNMGQVLEWKFPEEKEALEEILPHRHFAHLKFHMTSPGIVPGTQR